MGNFDATKYNVIGILNLYQLPGFLGERINNRGLDTFVGPNNIKSNTYENYCCWSGNVGATVAENMVRRELAEEIVLLDIKEGFAEGKAMDMNQTATLNGFDSKVVGSTNDYSKTAGSAVAVITSGIPRKRDDS